jgi:phosphotriesterase-related protein
MNVVVATGVYTHENLTPYFDSRTETALMDAFLYEIEHGIQETDIRPGFIKCASDHLGLLPAVEKVMRAAARASARSGLPLMTHSSAKDRGGLDQQELLASEGVDLTRVTIGHSGDTTDLEYLKKLADRGSYLGMDRYGLDDMLHSDERSATVAALCADGYADKVLLAHDCPCTYDRNETEETWSRRPNWNWGFIPATVLPDLTARGVADKSIEQMTLTNPRVWLTGE